MSRNLLQEMFKPEEKETDEAKAKEKQQEEGAYELVISAFSRYYNAV